ncbi:hypothetical protein D3C72_1903470 [compost metagenome]
MLIPEIEVTFLISGFSLRIFSTILLTKASVLTADEPSGKVAPIINTPASSLGIKPDGLALNSPTVPT